MTRDEATELLNCSLSELADKLEISTAAIARWNPLVIPPLRESQIRDLSEGRIPVGLQKHKQTVSDVSKQTNV